MTDGKKYYEKPIIMVVDDDGAFREVLIDNLADLGYEAVAAASKAEALSAIASIARDVALVLSDLEMPGGSGLDLRAALYEQHRDIPFVILSGLVTRELALRGVELKVAAFLHKPARLEELAAVIQREGSGRIERIRDRMELESTFVQEAGGLLEDLESHILALESQPTDRAVVDAIFRAVHTIKGSSGALDDRTLYRFTHAFEDRLSRYKRGLEAVTPEVVSTLLRGVDVMRRLLALAAAGQAEPASIEELLARTAAPNPADAGEKSPPSEAPPEDVRVEAKALDDLLALSGETIVLRNMVNRAVRTFERGSGDGRDLGALAELLEEMHKVNAAIQGKVADLRRMPVAAVLRPLQRTVRDLARSLSKEIDLVVEGAGLRVDSSIYQTLRESLIHLVRNCADHGIEDPATRVAAGKLASGRITIAIVEQRASVVVRLGDDGRGIDVDRVRRKAVEAGLVSELAAGRLGRAETLALIFAPGFSTAAHVSEVSGRGVGMDMVKTAVERIKGTIVVETEVGRGSEFTLTLPIPRSVVIIQSLLVACAGQTFGLPQEFVARLVRLDAAARARHVSLLQGVPMMGLDGDFLALVRLDELLGLARQGSPLDDSRDTDVVIVKAEGRMFGLVVDQILDGEEIVVKPMSPTLAQVDAYSGVTFLADGAVGLVLNPARLAERVVETVRPERPAPVRCGTHTRDLALFALGASGTFALPITDISRIETVAAAEVCVTGSKTVMAYRGEILPLIDLASALAFGNPPPAAARDLTVLIVETNAGLVGYTIESTIDFVSTDAAVDDGGPARRGVLGEILIGDAAVSLLDAGVLRNRRESVASAHGKKPIIAHSTPTAHAVAVRRTVA